MKATVDKMFMHGSFFVGIAQKKWEILFRLMKKK